MHRAIALALFLALATSSSARVPTGEVAGYPGYGNLAGTTLATGAGPAN